MRMLPLILPLLAMGCVTTVRDFYVESSKVVQCGTLQCALEGDGVPEADLPYFDDFVAACEYDAMSQAITEAIKLEKAGCTLVAGAAQSCLNGLRAYATDCAGTADYPTEACQPDAVLDCPEGIGPGGAGPGIDVDPPDRGGEDTGGGSTDPEAPDEPDEPDDGSTGDDDLPGDDTPPE